MHRRLLLLSPIYKNFIGQLIIPSSGILEYWSSPSTSKSFVFFRMTRMTVSIALQQNEHGT